MNLITYPLQDYIDLLSRRGLLAENTPAVPNGGAPVKLVSYDSCQVVPGTLFICKGAHFKGEFCSRPRSWGPLPM